MDRISMKVKGISCGACAKRIENALKGNYGVSDISIAMNEGMVTAVGEDLQEQKIKNAICDLGYEV